MHRAGEQRDWVKLATNVAILGAAATAIATGAPAVPIAAAIGIVEAFRRKAKDPDAAAFVDRFLNEVDAWCTKRNAFGRMRSPPSEWRGPLLARLESSPPRDNAAAQELFRSTLFSPAFDADRDICTVLAEELTADLPKLIVDAGDRFGALGALRALQEADIARLEVLIRDLPQRHKADPALMSAYLAKLIKSLDADRWSERLAKGAGSLGLSVVQQRLTLTPVPPGTGRPVLVDDLVQRCDRLVILAGPGAGKSWTARRAAIRVAEVALDQLGSGMDMDNIELPLLAPCSDVLDRDIDLRWDRLINATLDSAHTDPGTALRLSELLRNHQRVLIVLDGLDEAARPQRDSIYQLIDAHPAGRARLVVTSRPGSWDEALLELEGGNDRHVIGQLEPFADDDMRSAVCAWLADVRDTRVQLLRLLEANKCLGLQAKTPLLCAMLCLVARHHPSTSGDPFELFEPGRRLELYEAVIVRLLWGSWRDSTQAPSDTEIDDAIRWLEGLAATGNKYDRVTGLGQWPEPIPHPGPPSDLIAYVSNVAAPDPRPVGTPQTWRFIHRSLREHLTARILCQREPVDLAVELLPHLWFDPAWADVIPSVIAGHPDADHLVDELDRLVDEIAPQDPTHAFENALLEAAARCSHDTSANPRRSTVIELAIHSALERHDPRSWGHVLRNAGHWPGADVARQDILDQLATPSLDGNITRGLAEALVALAPTDHHDETLAQQVLDLFATTNFNRYTAGALALALGALAPTDPQAQQGAQRILDLLADPSADLHPSTAGELAQAVGALVGTGPRAEAFAQYVLELLATPDLDPIIAGQQAQVLAVLAPAGPLAQQGAQRILDLLTTPDLEWNPAYPLAEALVALAQAGPQPETLAQQVLDLLTTGNLGPYVARRLAEALLALEPTGPHTPQGAQRILDLLATPNLQLDAAGALAEAMVASGPPGPYAQQGAPQILDLLADPTANQHPEAAVALAQALVASGPPGPYAQRGASRILGLLADTISNGQLPAASALAEALAALAPTGPYAQQGAQRILDLLADRTANQHPEAANRLARVVGPLAQAGPHPETLAQRVLDRLATPDLDPYVAPRLARTLVELAPTGPHTQQGAQRILDRLATTPNLHRTAASALLGALVELAPTGPHAQQGAQRILDLLATTPGSSSTASELVRAFVALAPAVPHAETLAQQVLDRLATPDLAPGMARQQAQALVAVAPTGPLTRQAVERILDLLAKLRPIDTGPLAEALVALAPTGPYAQQGVQRILDLLATANLNLYTAGVLAEALVALAPTGPHAQQGAQRILDLLATPNLNWYVADRLTKALGRLRCAVTFESWKPAFDCPAVRSDTNL
jgi:NACHT domain